MTLWWFLASDVQLSRLNICDLRDQKIRGIESQKAKMSDIKQKAREIGDERILVEYECVLSIW